MIVRVSTYYQSNQSKVWSCKKPLVFYSISIVKIWLTCKNTSSKPNTCKCEEIIYLCVIFHFQSKVERFLRICLNFDWDQMTFLCSFRSISLQLTSPSSILTRLTSQILVSSFHSSAVADSRIKWRHTHSPFFFTKKTAKQPDTPLTFANKKFLEEVVHDTYSSSPLRSGLTFNFCKCWRNIITYWYWITFSSYTILWV